MNYILSKIVWKKLEVSLQENIDGVKHEHMLHSQLSISIQLSVIYRYPTDKRYVDQVKNMK